MMDLSVCRWTIRRCPGTTIGPRMVAGLRGGATKAPPASSGSVSASPVSVFNSPHADASPALSGCVRARGDREPDVCRGQGPHSRIGAVLVAD